MTTFCAKISPLLNMVITPRKNNNVINIKSVLLLNISLEPTIKKEATNTIPNKNKDKIIAFFKENVKLNIFIVYFFLQRARIQVPFEFLRLIPKYSE